MPRIPGYPICASWVAAAWAWFTCAKSESAGGLVALKTILPVVKPNATTLARFLREGRDFAATGASAHCLFRDMGQANGLLSFAMDYVPGTDAGTGLATEGPLPVTRALHWMCQMLDGLTYAHQKGFVHRDLKPSNLLVSQAEEQDTIKIADFGLAHTYQASQLSGLTMTGSSGGTPSFMPPEQVTDFRSVKPAADQYGAAATLYHLLTNRPLYDGVGTMVDSKAGRFSPRIPYRCCNAARTCRRN